MTFCGLVRREVCPFVPTGSAHRPKSPAEGVLGTNKECPVRMQPSWSAEYSQKCTVLPGGPVRVAKTMPMPTSASPFCCTDFSECRARVSQPGSRGGPEGMKFVASSARKGKHLMCFPSCAGLQSSKLNPRPQPRRPSRRGPKNIFKKVVAHRTDFCVY